MNGEITEGSIGNAERAAGNFTRDRAGEARAALEVNMARLKEAVFDLHRTINAAATGESIRDGRDGVSRDDFERAMATRGIIGMALGMLMERFSLEEGPAWDLLRQLANDREMRVAEVARRIVDRQEPVERPGEV